MVVPALSLEILGNAQQPRSDRLPAVRAGEEVATTLLVRRYWRGAYAVANSICHDPEVAEEVAQDAVLAAIQSLDRFDASKPFAPWLHRIAANKAIDAARSQQRRGRLRDDLRTAIDREGPAEALPAPLAAVLEQLAPTDRAIVVLRHLFDYRSEEIGEMLGMPAGTVRRRLAESLSEIRAKLPRQEVDDV